MNAFTDIRSGGKESPSEYMRKVFKITGYALSVNKVFIILMLLASLLTIIIFAGMRTGSIKEPFIIITSGLGFFIPIIMFQHMFKRGEFDFYAAMPIKRSRYFWGFTLAGIIAFLIIYFFIYVIMLVMNFREILECFLPGLVLFFTVYASALLAIMLSKSFFVFFLTCIVLNAFVFETIRVLWNIIGVNFEAYYFKSKGIIYFFSPLSAMDLFYSGRGLYGLLPLGMAVIEFAAAFFLHCIRNNEGRSPLVFAKTRYPLQYIIMFMAAFLAGLGRLSDLRYEVSDEKNIGNFCRIFFRDESFITTTLIVIFVTFIMTNMIFENTPRGVFRKIYHLITFTAGYWIVYVLVIGGLIYPNAPQSFVPFESNAAVVTAQSYESKTRAEYEAVYNAWQKAQQDISDYVDANYFNPDKNEYQSGFEEDSEYQRLNEICEKAYNEYNRWDLFGNMYTERPAEYYLRSTGVTMYLITDKEYISYLSERVKENAENANYVDWVFGYQNIVAEPAVSIEDNPGANDRFYNEYYYSNATIMDIRFYSLSEERMAQLTGNFGEEGFEAMYNHVYYNYGNHKYDLRTFVDTEESLKEFESHTADSFIADDVSGIRYNFSPNSVY